MNKAKSIEELRKIRPLEHEAALKLFITTMNNKEALISEPGYFDFPNKDNLSTYGLFFPYSYVVRIRGRFDPNAFSFYPKSLAEDIIQSIILHEYNHLQHFSATPAGIYHSISLVVNLLNFNTALRNTFGTSRKTFRVPILSQRDNSDFQAKPFSDWFEQYQSFNIAFSSNMEIMPCSEEKYDVVYPYDLSELSEAKTNLQVLVGCYQ